MIERKDIFINEMESVKDALKKLDKSSKKVLLVVDNENKLLGTVTDGDIRRFMLRGGSLENDIKEIYNKTPMYLKKRGFSIDKAKDMLIKNKIELIPILDSENKVVDFITWSQAFSDSKSSVINTSQVKVPVVIMAGGKSTRLEPFSKILPKPLIPIGDKPIVEIIIDEFKKHGINKYYLILNYKGEMVELYFNSIEKDYELKYIRETDFWGTAGGLKLLEDVIDDVFMVSNCDVIVKANFEEVVNFHKEQKAFLTILSSFRHYKIPYGVVKFKEGGEVIDIFEKPEYTFTINTGVYVMNKKCLQFISEKTYFDMTDLVRQLIKNDKKIVTYLVNENDHIDIGQWEEYKMALEKLKVL